MKIRIFLRILNDCFTKKFDQLVDYIPESGVIYQKNNKVLRTLIYWQLLSQQ